MRNPLLSRNSVSTLLPTIIALAMTATSLVATSASAVPSNPPVITDDTFGRWTKVIFADITPEGTVIDPLVYNRKTVSGTSEGTTGDTVDVYCVTLNDLNSSKLASAVPVLADGTWSTQVDARQALVQPGYSLPRTDTHSLGCKLAAVWSGSPSPGFNEVSAQVLRFVALSPNIVNFHIVDWFVEFQGTDGFVDFQSAAWCGLCDMYVGDEFGRAAASDQALFWGNAMVGGTQDSQASVTVDGYNAVLGGDVFKNAPATPDIQQRNDWTIDVTNNGDLVTTETSRLSGCATPGSSNFSQPICHDSNGALLDLGVSLTRTTVLLPDGLTYFIKDMYFSNDLKPHTINLNYWEGNISPTDVKLPAGVINTPAAQITGNDGGSWIPATTDWRGTTVTGFGPAPATIEFSRNAALAPGIQNPIGAVTYGPAPDSIIGANSGRIHTLFANRTVTENQNLIVRLNYAMAASQAALDERKQYLRNNAMQNYPAATVVWAPVTRVPVSTKTLSSLATTNTGNAPTYSVSDAGMTGCTINAATGDVTFSRAGECTLRAFDPGTDALRATSEQITLTVVCDPLSLGSVKFATSKSKLSSTAKSTLGRAVTKVVSQGCASVKLTGHIAKATSPKTSAAKRKSVALTHAKLVQTWLKAAFTSKGVTVSISTVTKPRSDRGKLDKNLLVDVQVVS